MNCLEFQTGPSLAIARMRGNEKQVKKPAEGHQGHYVSSAWCRSNRHYLLMSQPRFTAMPCHLRRGARDCNGLV